jgi:hypothetical protein
MIINSIFNTGDSLFMLWSKIHNKKQIWFVLKEPIVIDHIDIKLFKQAYHIRVFYDDKNWREISELYYTKEEAQIECDKRNN